MTFIHTVVNLAFNRSGSMNTILVFIPCMLYINGPGLLYGFVTSHQSVKVFYILGLIDSAKNKGVKRNKQRIIGYRSESNSQTSSLREKRSNWIHLGVQRCEFVVYKIFTGGQKIECSQTHVISIIYDQVKFIQTELLVQNMQDGITIYGDHLRTLAYKLTTELPHSLQRTHCMSVYFISNVFIQYIIRTFLGIVDLVQYLVTLMHPVLKYTTLGLHLQVFLKSLTWILKSALENGRVTLKVGNYIVAVMTDICIGMLLLNCVIASVSPSHLLLHYGEVVVVTLQDLLQWLMGIPAGLKLNFALNTMLGKFFLYHINLWWTFIVIAKPFMEIIFQIFLCLGRLGITFQASILADLLALVSFHSYCIYVYAARLYNLQVSGLIALWRLFLGRKWNPLRGRVDSCQYAPDQLFIGTLAFTMLLFLLPTTFMYYVVFATLRVVIVGLGGLLIRVRYVLQCLPLYVSILWFLQSTAVTSTVHMIVKKQAKSDMLVLSVQPVTGSWWETVMSCMPESIPPPPKVEWCKLVQNILSGSLIYPV